MLTRYQTVAASSLMIKDVVEDDNGSYQCRAKNSVDTLDAVAEVTVQGKLARLRSLPIIGIPKYIYTRICRGAVN